MIKLGSGTGLCGIMVAHGLNAAATVVPTVHVTVTDLPLLQPLLQRNVTRNRNVVRNHHRRHHQQNDSCCNNNNENDFVLSEYYANNYPQRQRRISKEGEGGGGDNYGGSGGGAVAVVEQCNITVSVLEWGDREAEARHGTFDVVFGADVVASLYDPVALAHTIANLCHNETAVYIGFKERLSTVHRQFEAAMANLFRSIEIVARPVVSRNRNPDVNILVAHGKL